LTKYQPAAAILGTANVKIGPQLGMRCSSAWCHFPFGPRGSTVSGRQSCVAFVRTSRGSPDSIGQPVETARLSRIRNTRV